MKKILIIDDSALMRRVFSDIITSDKRFSVIGTLNNGLEAFHFIKEKSKEIDAVLLDINMPIMDGLSLLKKLKEEKIEVTCIVVSTLVKEGADETIMALELGAFDFVEKPDSIVSLRGDTFKKKLLDVLSYATKLNVTNNDVKKKDGDALGQMRKRVTSVNAPARKLVAIACSTGGPKALQAVIPKLPPNLDAAILVVQHMPSGFTKSLADRLNETSRLMVKEVEHGDLIKKGTVYIAKGGYQMKHRRTTTGEAKLELTDSEVKNGLKPCADIMYESLVDATYDEIICVVLTGMGSDGTQGILKLSNSKCVYVIAQDEATSTVYGMPKVITETGIVDEVVTLDKVAEAIQKKVGCF